MEQDTLELGEFRFKVLKDKCTLHALISNATDYKLFWMINVPCVGSDVKFEDESVYCWQPKVYHESMMFSCRSWKQLEGKHCVASADDDDPPAIYLYQHLDLEKSDLFFESRLGAIFNIDWHFSWSGRDGRVRTSVSFAEVTIWLDEVRDEQSAKHRLQEDLDLSEFSSPEIALHPSAGPRFKFKPLP